MTRIEIAVFGDDTVASLRELTEMSEHDIYLRGGFYLQKSVTPEQAKELGVDLSYLDGDEK